MNNTRTVLVIIAAAALWAFAACDNLGDDELTHIHRWGNWGVTTPATCIKKGVETRTCSIDSSHTQTRETDINPNAHQWGEATVTIPATCEEDGEGSTKCVLCNQEKDDYTIDALGHDWGDWDVTTPATCEEDGEGTRTCKRKGCDQEDSDHDIPALGHDWGEWTEVTKAATCTTPGDGKRVCKRNDTHVESSEGDIPIDPEAHVWNLTRIKISDATETENGIEAITCQLNEEHTKDPIIAYATGTEGLNYDLINDGAAYRVNRGTKPITDFPTLHIPAYHWNEETSAYLPVTEISNGTTNTSASNAFGGSNANDGANTTLTAVTFAEDREPTTISAFAFQYCPNLTGDLTIPADVTFSGNYTFRGAGITSVTISEGVTISGSYTFSGCTSLTEVTFSPDVAINGTNAFQNCTGLTNVTIPAGVTISGTYAFSGCTGLTQATFSLGVTSIGSNMFQGCTNLINVTIPASVATIGGSAFYGCSSLPSITIPAGVTYIGDSAFYNCSSLASITIPAGVTAIGTNVFYGCSSLASITIPKGITSISTAAFNLCTSLTAIIVDNDNQNYSSHDGVLYNKEKTTLMKAPPGISGSVTIPSNVTLISTSAFGSCTSLTSVTFPSDIVLMEIPGYIFWDCTSLISINIPRTVTVIDTAAFNNCTSLTSVTFPEDSLLSTITNQAFNNCKSITEFIIPASVTTIGNANNFATWVAAQTIYVKGHPDAASAITAWGPAWIPTYSTAPAVKYLQSDGTTWHDKDGNPTDGPQGL